MKRITASLPVQGNWTLLQFTAVALFTLTLSACSGGSSDSTPQTSNNGAEPRIDMVLTAPAQKRLTVTTTSAQEVTISSESTSRTITSVTNLDVRLEGQAAQYQIDIFPELVSFSPEELKPLAYEPSRQSHRYDANGQQERFSSDITIVDALALESFSLPAMTLSHPAGLLGVGASWTESNALPQVSATTTTTIDAIDEVSVTVSKNIVTGSDAQNRYAVTGIMSAVYSRPSLLLESADIALSVTFTDQLYINGTLQTIVDQSTFNQRISEAGL